MHFCDTCLNLGHLFPTILKLGHSFTRNLNSKIYSFGNLETIFLKNHPRSAANFIIVEVVYIVITTIVSIIKITFIYDKNTVQPYTNFST